MRRKTDVTIDGQTYAVAELRMRENDALDEWLAKLPRPPIGAADTRDMAAAVTAMVAAVGEPANLAGLPASEQQVFSLNLRTQVAAVIGEKLRDLGDAEWPPRMMGGDGFEYLTETGPGRRQLARVALATAGLDEAAAADAYDAMTMAEFNALVAAFLPALDAGEPGPNAGAAGDAGSPSAGTTSTTSSPQPTAGPPTSSTT